MDPCPICQKHKSLEEVIYEDTNWIVTHGPIQSQVLGYLYVEPKRHIENWGDFMNEELVTIGLIIKRLELALKKVLPVDRVYVVTISEAVRHLHFHIIPRLDEEEKKGLPLIKQATQQKSNDRKITPERQNIFIRELKSNLS